MNKDGVQYKHYYGVSRSDTFFAELRECDL